MLVCVRLTPKSSRDALEGLDTLSDGRVVMKARVRAVPEDGKANEALVRLIARTLETPRSHVGVVAGATSRLKTIRIDGPPGDLEEALARLCGLA